MATRERSRRAAQPSPTTRRRARGSRAGASCSAWRGPKQWIKNVLVLAAPGAAGVLDRAAAARATPLIAFVCFCLAASGTYFLERRARRRGRPPPPDEAVPAGRGGRGLGRGPRSSAASLLVVAAIALSFAARWQLALVIGGYLVLHDRRTASG